MTIHILQLVSLGCISKEMHMKCITGNVYGNLAVRDTRVKRDLYLREHCYIVFTGVLLTAAGIVEELSSRQHPLRGQRREKWTSSLNQRVVDLLLLLLLVDLRLRVKEGQLPPPPPLLPRLHLWRRHILGMGGVWEVNLVQLSTSCQM